jgi:2-hydroxychromene-2-carboxylate isomerase
MGILVDLDERRAAVRARRSRHGRSPRIELFFDLSDPFSYLAAERVERSFEAVVWTPAVRSVVHPAATAGDRERAEARARELRMPLVWPERHLRGFPRAMRAASLASELGRGAAFALAAGRLAYCGGFDLEEPEILAEAAAAAGVGLGASLNAARDRSRDTAMVHAAEALLAIGADRLPALSVGGLVFSGEERIVEAVVAARFAAG